MGQKQFPNTGNSLPQQAHLIQGRGDRAQLCPGIPARFNPSLSLRASISLGIQPGTAMGCREATLGPVPAVTSLSPATPGLECGWNPQKAGVPKLGEGTRPCLSRQCHLLPPHTQAGDGDRDRDSSALEPSPELLPCLWDSPAFPAKPRAAGQQICAVNRANSPKNSS